MEHPEIEFHRGLIDTDVALKNFMDGFAQQGWVALDTEFFRRDTYYPKLCLIQLCDGKKLGMVDAIALPSAPAVVELLGSSQITKIIHSPEQDCEALLRCCSVVPTPIFDTQLCAAFMGHAFSCGYGQLIESYLNIKLGKAHSQTDWRKRPLSDAQLTYAAEDVIYLGQVYAMQREQLQASGKNAWFDEETMNRVYCGDLMSAPQLVAKLSFGQVRQINPAVLEALVLWRESLAQQFDLPRRWVIDDETLAHWSVSLPDNAAIYLALARLSRDALEPLVEQLRTNCYGLSDATVTLSRPNVPDADARLLFDQVRNVLNQRAQALNINPQLLATRADLQKLVSGDKSSTLRSGWRYEAVGRELEESLTSGFTSLSAGDAGSSETSAKTTRTELKP